MTIKLRVDSRVRVRIADLSDAVMVKLQKEFTYKNPEFAAKAAMGITTWGTPHDIKTFAQTDKDITFPRGGYRRVCMVIEDAGYETKTIDKRHEGAFCSKWPKYIGHELRYYQRNAIAAAIAKQNCIVRAPTGSGKSLLAIAYAAELGLNTLVILPTVALFKQWCKDALAALKMKPSELGIIHGRKRNLRPLTVAVQASLINHVHDDHLRDFFGVVIVDECQKAAAKTYIAAVDPFPAKYRLGISADERRKDRKEFLTADLFADVAYEIQRSNLEREGFVLDVEIRVVPTDFDAPWFGVVPEDEDGEPVETEREGVDFKRLLDQMLADEDRNRLILDCVLPEVEAGNQAIVLSHRREHCQAIDREFVKRNVRSGFFIGGADYAREFDATRAGIEAGTLRVGVGTYGALGYGVNLPSVSVGVATTPIGGNKQNFNQVRGRLCRLGKKSARLYVLWDRRVYPQHLANICAWNPTVSVLEDNGTWTNGRHYLKANRKRLTRSES